MRWLLLIGSSLGDAVLAMRGRALACLVVLAACGGDRIVIELSGAVPGATRVDVTLLEPVVLAKLQRRNDRDNTSPVPANAPERVFYVAQRSTVEVPLDGAAIDGLQFELQDGGGAYVPLVIARDAGGVLAMGIYNPASVFAAEVGREHRPDAVESVGDVTIYPVQLEPVKGLEANPSQPTSMGKGEVMVVRCGRDGPISGAVWRRADDKQLRLLLPLGADKPTAVARLDAPDLDCDQHSPGPVGLARRGPGDELDCDDTAAVVHAKATEQCSAFDEDCDPATTTSQVACACQATGGICPCEDPGIPGDCPDAAHNQTCAVPAEGNSTGRTPCDSRGQLVAMAECAAGCAVTLVSGPPGWDIKIGNDRGLHEPVLLPAGELLPIAIRPAAVPSTGPNVALLSVKPSGGVPAIHAVNLKLVGDECMTANAIVCAAQ